MSEPRYYSSPVDYEAWRKGYMPPSEHVLIHKLSMDEVKVVASSQTSDTGWWLVVTGGKPLTAAQKKSIRFLMETMDEEDPPVKPPEEVAGIEADWHKIGPIPRDPELEEKLSRVKHDGCEQGD